MFESDLIRRDSSIELVENSGLEPFNQRVTIRKRLGLYPGHTDTHQQAGHGREKYPHPVCSLANHFVILIRRPSELGTIALFVLLYGRRKGA